MDYYTQRRQYLSAQCAYDNLAPADDADDETSNGLELLDEAIDTLTSAADLVRAGGEFSDAVLLDVRRAIRDLSDLLPKVPA